MASDFDDCEAFGSEFGEALDGHEDGEPGFRVSADDATDVAELGVDGFEELGDGHGIELVGEGEDALVVLGDGAAAGICANKDEARKRVLATARTELVKRMIVVSSKDWER